MREGHAAANQGAIILGNSNNVLSRRSARILLAALFLGAGCGGAARAQNLVGETFREIETRYIFGFTVGSDIGPEGEKEFVYGVVGRFGKRDGTYRAFDHTFEFEYVPTQFDLLEFEAPGTTHYIRNVTDLEDRNTTQFKGLAFAWHRLLIERGPASPIGVAALVELEWSRIDGTAGTRERAYALETKLLADVALIPNRLFFAVNASYEPEVVKPKGEPTEHESELGFSAAISYRPIPIVLVGAGVQYFRVYQGLGLNRFEGDALFVGPNLYVQLTKKTFLTAAFATQVAGRSVDEPGKRLNLHDFERHRARLRIHVEF